MAKVKNFKGTFTKLQKMTSDVEELDLRAEHTGGLVSAVAIIELTKAVDRLVAATFARQVMDDRSNLLNSLTGDGQAEVSERNRRVPDVSNRACVSGDADSRLSDARVDQTNDTAGSTPVVGAGTLKRRRSKRSAAPKTKPAS